MDLREAAKILRLVADSIEGHPPKRDPGPNGILAMAEANRTANGHHPFTKWVVQSKWVTVSRWAKGHGLWRGMPNAWMAIGPAFRPCPPDLRTAIEHESNGAVPASVWR